MVVPTCSLGYSGSRGRKIAWAQELKWAMIMPLHSSLGNKARLHLKKKKKEMDWQATWLWKYIPILGDVGME